MWTKEVIIKTKASKEAIWKLWADVSNWKSWDDQVMESSLDGSFTIGEKGLLRPRGGPKSTFELVELTKEKSFTSRSSLPLGKMDFIHSMEESNGELVLKHRIEISGILTFIFSRVIGNKLIKELPKALNKLVDLAENK